MNMSLTDGEAQDRLNKGLPVSFVQISYGAYPGNVVELAAFCSEEDAKAYLSLARRLDFTQFNGRSITCRLKDEIRQYVRYSVGEMTERLKVPAWKAGERATVPWVRIPLSPF